METLIKNNTILAFSEDIAHLEPETPCINCGYTKACPILNAYYDCKAFENNDVEALKKYRVSICMEWELIYVCPAKATKYD